MKEYEKESELQENEGRLNVLNMCQGADEVMDSDDPFGLVLSELASDMEQLIGKAVACRELVKAIIEAEFENFSNSDLRYVTYSGAQLCRTLATLSDEALTWHLMQGYLNTELRWRERED